MSVLAMPIAPNAGAAATQAELEAQRQVLLTGAADVIRAQQELNLTLREYNAAHGFASVSAYPPRVAGNWLRDRNLDQDLRREVHYGKTVPASLGSVEKPKYSSPDKTLRAARDAVEACDSLSGDALAKQQAHVKKLLSMAEKQNAEPARSKKDVEVSQTRTAPEKSNGQASSPYPDKRREKAVNGQQMIVYDPVLAGK
jgi:hypothetical protein